MTAKTSKQENENTAMGEVKDKDMEQLKAALLAEVKAEAAGIIEAAKKEATDKAAEIIAAARAEERVPSDEQLPKAQNSAAEQWLNEYVTVELFRDSGKYKDDVYVSIGDDNCLIQRGKPVQIKRKFALALDLARLQQKAASKMQDDAAKDAMW